MTVPVFFLCGVPIKVCMLDDWLLARRSISVILLTSNSIIHMNHILDLVGWRWACLSFQYLSCTHNLFNILGGIRVKQCLQKNGEACPKNLLWTFPNGWPPKSCSHLVDFRILHAFSVFSISWRRFSRDFHIQRALGVSDFRCQQQLPTPWNGWARQR